MKFDFNRLVTFLERVRDTGSGYQPDPVLTEDDVKELLIIKNSAQLYHNLNEVESDVPEMVTILGDCADFLIQLATEVPSVYMELCAKNDEFAAWHRDTLGRIETVLKKAAGVNESTEYPVGERPEQVHNPV